MSSVFGKLHTDKRPVTNDDLTPMLCELNHWNADDKNLWAGNEVGLGHLMLYNTPESLREKLPLYDNIYQLAITSDARIDNREELYQLLQIDTPTERLLPDSGIIIRLYKKYGAECVKYLVGDFAFAIWDEVGQKLFCARDQMGVKPFFYYNDDHFFAFASEKKGLLCIPGINKTIDRQFFYNQAIWPPVQAADTTLYKNIKRLPPAHTLTFYPSKNNLHLTNYWTLDACSETQLLHRKDYYEGLLHHFDVAVKCRLRSHYPIGVELSGGLDSSAITGAASLFLKSAGKNITTFSNTDNGDPAAIAALRGENEKKFIDSVIEFNGIDDHIFLTESIWNDPLDEVDFSLKVNDGLELWNMLWLAPIKNAAKAKNVRTLLSGFPGDEMVTYRGQFHFLDFLDNREYAKYFSAKPENDFKKLKPFLAPGLEFCFHKLRNILTFNGKRIKQVSDFITIPAKYRLTLGDVVWRDKNYLERFKSHRHYQKYRLLKAQVSLRMETETRYGIAFRTEPRFPMADVRLTQYYLSMPDDIKSEGEISRSAYREAVGKYLPQSVFQRDSKSGNIAPFRSIPGSVNARKESMLKMLNAINPNSENKNKIISYLPQNENKLLRYLELLRWIEKNKKNH